MADGTTTGSEDVIFYALGGAALVGAAGADVYAVRKRRNAEQ